MTLIPPAPRPHAASSTARARCSAALPALALVLPAFALALQGCSAPAPTPSSAAAPPPDLLPRETPRYHAVLGRMLVLPVSALAPSPTPNSNPLRGDTTITVPRAPRLDDGRELAPRAVRLTVQPAPAPPASLVAPAAPDLEAAALWWLGEGHAWTITPLDLARPVPADATLLIVLPADAVGQGIWFGPRRVALNWVTPALTAATPDGLAADLPDTAPARDAFFAACVRALAANPTRRWQARLLAPSADFPPFADAALEAVAGQFEGVWTAGLARLRAADPLLFAAVVRRIAARAEIPALGGAVVAPLVAADDPALHRLAALLVDSDADLSPLRLTERVRAWLATRPPATAWLCDAGGALDALTHAPIPRLGLLNLSETPTLAWAAFRADAATPELIPLAPGEGRMLASPALPPQRPGASPVAAEVIAHVGAWQRAIPAPPVALPVTPPGLPITGLTPDWNLLTWTSQSSGVAPNFTLPNLALLLLRDRPAPGEPERWYLYGELATPAAARVECYLGPTGATTHRLSIDLPSVPPQLEPARPAPSTSPRSPAVSSVPAPTGAAFVRLGRSAADTPLPGATIRRDAARWIVRVPLPEAALPASGPLQLGVIVTLAPGGSTLRAAWPAPLMPWQIEPPRLAVDLSAWDRR